MSAFELHLRVEAARIHALQARVPDLLDDAGRDPVVRLALRKRSSRQRRALKPSCTARTENGPQRPWQATARDRWRSRTGAGRGGGACGGSAGEARPRANPSRCQDVCGGSKAGGPSKHMIPMLAYARLDLAHTHLLPLLEGGDDQDAGEKVRMAAEVLSTCTPVSDLQANDSGRDVPLCMTMSAPHLKGYWSGGGPNVESTRSQPPALCTLSA